MFKNRESFPYKIFDFLSNNTQKEIQNIYQFLQLKADLVSITEDVFDKLHDEYFVNKLLDEWHSHKERVVNWQFGFQTPVTPVMEGIVNFHHDLFFFLTVILFSVMYMLFICVRKFSVKRNDNVFIITHAPTLEIIWTLIPAFILIMIAIPSFSLLYSMDEIVDPAFSFKVIGHQWYWTYEFMDPDLKYFLNEVSDDSYLNDFTNFKNKNLMSIWNEMFKNEISKEDFALNDNLVLSNVDTKQLLEDVKIDGKSFNGNENIDSINNLLYKNQNWSWFNKLIHGKLRFDSYMIASDDLINTDNYKEYLLEVDNRLYIPIQLIVRVLVTSADVLHAWAVPSLGVKIDACPGRLNETWFYMKRPGIFYGQCSEICGVNHGFMPIVVQGIDLLGNGLVLDSEAANYLITAYLYVLKQFYNQG